MGMLSFAKMYCLLARNQEELLKDVSSEMRVLQIQAELSDQIKEKYDLLDDTKMPVLEPQMLANMLLECAQIEAENPIKQKKFCCDALRVLERIEESSTLDDMKRTVWTSIISFSEWGQVDMNKPDYMNSELPKLLFHECLLYIIKNNITVVLTEKNQLLSVVDDLMGADHNDEKTMYSHGGSMGSSDVKLLICASLQSLELDLMEET